MNTPAMCQHALAMMTQGDPPTCSYAAAERKSIQVLNTYTCITQKVAIFAEKIAKLHQ